MNETLQVFTAADRKRLLSRNAFPNGFDDFNPGSLIDFEHPGRRTGLNFPDFDSVRAVDRLFFRAEQQTSVLLQTTFHYDVYASLDALTGSTNIRSIAGDEYVDKQIQELLTNRSVANHTIEIEMFQSLVRLQAAAQVDHGSADALSVLVNTILEGGRLAVVLAHGNTYHNPKTGSKEFHVIGIAESAEVSRVAADIASRVDTKGNLRYRLVYFNACNPDRLPVSMEQDGMLVPIPVITHNSDNVSLYEGISCARVSWPPGTDASLWQSIVSKFKATGGK